MRPDQRPAREPATAVDFKALSNPLRLQILRLCSHQPRTNAELAQHLGRDPSTVLHHVRLLVDTGFLEPDTPRTGPRGPKIKPYRATRRSWALAVDDSPREAIHHQKIATIDAFRTEALLADTDGLGDVVRLGIRLDADRFEELRTEIWDILHRYAELDDGPDSETYGLLWAWHHDTA